MIVVAGEALIDLVVRPDGSVTAALGGGPFNVARTIARLGGEVGFLGSISNDRFGTMLADRLVADGVSLEATVRTEAPTTLAAAELDDHGSATYRFYLTDTSAPALDRVPDVARRADTLHVGTLGLVLEPMATTLVGLLDDVADDVLVMTDPNCRSRVIRDRAAYLDRLARVYRRSHVVKLSTDDAEYLDDATEPIDLARRLVDGGVRVVLLTAGKEATWVVTPTGVDALPTPLVTVADTIGAGDSFCGGFLSWWRGNGFGVAELADHALVVEGALAAQAVSSYTVTQVGANPPHRDDLDASWSSCSRS
ncbi:MAG: carbohydrate kinase [Acidimicrobiales bacterium]|nr:carbohydrate kinase [Acidimicrobiales bacterium]MCB9394188.1 carbohydrate kinase [Acidimicrobiaceae bacterium]